ncbi:hypothetical protein ACFRCG_08160 [Embleya sp. NPDC056575]|uniref:hypothetical protein n=1 Tax=unclassified Embleya TaxID=2699296 RepID=UPI0036890122
MPIGYGSVADSADSAPTFCGKGCTMPFFDFFATFMMGAGDYLEPSTLLLLLA